MNDESVVHVVRHGRTTLNAEGRFRGRDDVPLDELGRAEAEVAARALVVCPIAVVVHSPLTRARETAEPIARHTSAAIEADPGLLDLDHGAWTALTPVEAASRNPDEFVQFRDDPRKSFPPGGEPLASVEARIVLAVDDIARRFPGQEVVVVSHEIPIRLLLSHVIGLDGAGTWNIPLPTGSVTTLRGSAGFWYIDQGPWRP